MPDHEEQFAANPPDRKLAPIAADGGGSLGALHLRLLETLAPPSILVDERHEILHLSPGAGRYLHFPGGEPSRNLLCTIDPGLREALGAALSQAARTGRSEDRAAQVVSVRGERTDLRLRVFPVREGGAVLFMVLLAPARIDHHEPAPGPGGANAALHGQPSSHEELSAVNRGLHSKVQELSHANSDLRNLMDATHIATVFLDRDLAITRYTPAAADLLRLAPSDVGRSLRQLSVDGLDAAELASDAARVLGKLAPIESEMALSDGASFLVRLLPYRTLEDRIAGVVISFIDISETLRAQEALRTSEELLRLVVENAREYAIFSIDLERRVTSWNSGAERLLGYAESEILGRTADVIFTLEDRNARAPEQEAKTALQEGRAGDDRIHVRKDGSSFWAEGVSMLMRDRHERPIGFVKILRDQTRARAIQQALERSQAELRSSLEETQAARRALEAADAAKDRFLAVLSHELRNPLASIASASELLMMPKLPEAAREKAAEVVQRQGKAMKVLLDELLDVSRLTLGRLNLAKRPVPVATVVQQALETTRPLVQAAAHELVVKLPPHPVEVDADPLRLGQVISNLVSNAAKYTPEGGLIEVSVEVFADEVVIQVSDNGIGMEPTQIDRMFDLFSQGERSTPGHSNSGLGIGLALARNIVEMHGGWIMASSAGAGQGSQLRVGLPLLRVGDVEVHAPEPEPGRHAPATAAEGELILVADDNGDAAWGLAKLLELSGFRAVLARSGEEALKVAEQYRPAIALLDIGMPDLSGHEVGRRLRGLDWGRDMILIAATGWGQEADIRHSMEAGFDAHLTKPLNVGRIKGLIEDLLTKRRR